METNYNRQMGLISNRKRSTSRVYFKAPTYRGGGNKSKCTSYQYFTRGGRKIVRKKCDRTCSCTRERNRFLLNIFHGPQKIGRTKTHNKSETPQQASQKATFQDGLLGKSNEISQKRRLGGVYRSQGCISAHTNSEGISKVFPFLHSKEGLSIYMPLFRTNNGTKGVHKNIVRGNSTSKKIKCEVSQLPRRLVTSKCTEKSIASRSGDIIQSPVKTRLYCQHRKVFPGAKSKCGVHRGSFSVSQRNCLSNSRENRKDKNSLSVAKNRQYSSKFPDSIGVNGLLYPNSSKRSVVHETNPATFSPILETVNNEYESNNSLQCSITEPSTMVAEQRQSIKRGNVNSSRVGFSSNVRCFKDRLRSTLTKPSFSGKMVKRAGKTAYKQSRVGSSFSGRKVFSTQINRSSPTDQIRQYISGSIRKQTGRHKICKSLSAGLGIMESSHKKQNRSESSSYCGQEKSLSRRLESGSHKAHRMVSGQSGSKQNFCPVGHPSDRSVCFRGKQESSDILHLVSKSAGNSNRRSVNFMGGDGGIRISSDLPHTQSSTAHANVQLSDCVDSSIMASEELVHRPVTVLNSISEKNSNNSRITLSTKNKDLSSKSSSFQFDSMAVVNQSFKNKGFPEQVRKLLLASWRPGTQKDYANKFTRFCSWCVKRKIDPLKASVNNCAEFLTSLFHSGLGYRTISGYRSMLSAMLPLEEGIKVGQHPNICRLLKGIFNSRPPVRKLIPEWDIEKVLGMLSKAPFEPLQDISLKYLTWKSVFLTAISTFRRCSDIQALRMDEGFMKVGKDGISFVRDGLAKQDRPNHISKTIFVPCYSANKLLDPRRVLLEYLKRTAGSRHEGKVTRLFLSTVEPHGPVSKQTIGSWISNVIRLAYKDETISVNPHSTRAIGSSWVLSQGASLQSILEAADWSSENTFIKFYYRNMESHPWDM